MVSPRDFFQKTFDSGIKGVLVGLVLVSMGCGSTSSPNQFLGVTSGATSSSPVTNDTYQLQSQASVSQDFQSIMIQGQVTSAKSASAVPLNITRVGSTSAGDETKVVYTDADGRFVTSFSVESQSSETFEVSVKDAPASVSTINVDLSGKWDGTLSLESLSGSCGQVPANLKIELPVQVDQSGKQFSVSLGKPLGIDGLVATISKDLSVSGEGTRVLGNDLTKAIGCFQNMTYSFSGSVDPEANEGTTFDITFQTTLLGVRPDCSPVPGGICSVVGRLTGLRL